MEGLLRHLRPGACTRRREWPALSPRPEVWTLALAARGERRGCAGRRRKRDGL